MYNINERFLPTDKGREQDQRFVRIVYLWIC